MPGSSKILIAAAGVAAVCHLQQSAFVPPAVRRTASLAAPAAVAAAASAPALADPIGDAAKKLSDAAYPFMKEVNWNSYAYLVKPGSASAGDWVKAVDKAILMGASMDSELLKKGVMAHHKAIGATSESNPVLSKADFEPINAAIGRMIASVKEADAKAAYAALMDFK